MTCWPNLRKKKKVNPKRFKERTRNDGVSAPSGNVMNPKPPQNKVNFPLVKPLPHHSFDSDAMKVYERLSGLKYKTYFVGGCIRDLLLGMKPKDFDLVTSALPRRIRKIFRNSRLIGKRFLLVNVFFGDKIVEVSTFRRTPWENGGPEKSNFSPISRDNSFGTDEEDALRRDFTINALFYDPSEREVIDYVNGINDLQMGKIRMIGDPEVRFCEDPVRIIRALKLKARLKFEIVPETQRALQKCVPKLAQNSSSRIFLELNKILRCGAAFPCFKHMAESSIFGIVAPGIQKIFDSEKHPGRQSMMEMLEYIDKAVPKSKGDFGDASLLAALCLPVVSAQKRTGWDIPGELYCQQKVNVILSKLGVSKKLMNKIVQVLRIHFYLSNPQNQTPEKVKKITRSQYLQDVTEFLSIYSLVDHSLEKVNALLQCQPVEEPSPKKHPGKERRRKDEIETRKKSTDARPS